MDSLSPNIFVKDIAETIIFYKSIGFKVATTVPEEGDHLWRKHPLVPYIKKNYPHFTFITSDR